jgi:hypothetical protein
MPLRSELSLITWLHDDGAMMMVSFFVPVERAAVVDNKHNSSKVSFQVMENEIVREETIR